MPPLGMACNPLKRLRAPSRLRLALPAPDIVEAILAGRTDQALMLCHLERPLPTSWEEQRRLLDRAQ
jgi:hypothetical protein